MAREKKPASTPTPLTYPAWKDAAVKDLLERHGIRTNVREEQWRDWFIRGMTPAVAADRAAPTICSRAHWSIAQADGSGSVCVTATRACASRADWAREQS